MRNDTEDGTYKYNVGYVNSPITRSLYAFSFFTKKVFSFDIPCTFALANCFTPLEGPFFPLPFFAAAAEAVFAFFFSKTSVSAASLAVMTADSSSRRDCK